MAKFSIASTNKNSFSIIGHCTAISSLVYDKLFSNNASIWFDEKPVYHFIPKGLWASAIDLKQNDNLLLSIKMNWKGELIIDTRFDNKLQSYIFKKTAKLNKEFDLYNNDKIIIAIILPNSGWDKFSDHYHIESTEIFDEIPNLVVMIYTLGYCTNYYMYKTYSPSV